MSFVIPPRLKPGDRVAIVAPSSGLAACFPWVYTLGLKRIHEVFHLEPVELPTVSKSTEFLEQHPQARAEDINEAFADSSIKGVIATIGGNDQIRILPYLNRATLAANPKVFCGYSDCTNLHLYLWNLGIISYYGGLVMPQFGMQQAMHEYTVQSLKQALFSPAIGLIQPAKEWTDADLDWSDPANLDKSRPLIKGKGWEWHHHGQELIEGRLWGGCLETLALHLAVKRYLPPIEAISGCILYVETSEEMPTSGFVYRFFATLAEMGMLQQLRAILVGIPKAQFCGNGPSEGRELFIANQKAAILQALSHYRLELPVVFDLNIGHTDPQCIIPNGGIVRIDPRNQTISFGY